MQRRTKNPGQRGFTLIEMLIVISLILILLSIAVPMYHQSVIKARESVLREDLFQMRQLISQYTLDKQKAPQALDDLIQGGYIKIIPNDPMTSLPNWEVVQEDTLLSVDQQDPGIVDVKSASGVISTEGTAYSSW
jgi:general secretion pathway protein G